MRYVCVHGAHVFITGELFAVSCCRAADANPRGDFGALSAPPDCA